MTSAQTPDTDVDTAIDVHVENVGGISDADVTLRPGVTVLAGRNATNRTSFLQALMSALGSEHVSLKGDADEGRVDLSVGGETFTRTLERAGSSVRTGGTPYLDKPELADLFAFLLESNEARRAVARGDDLRELIMRPVDTAAINAEIDRLKEEKRSIDDELDELDSLSDRLPELETRRTQLADRIEETEAELEAAREELETADASVQRSREEKDSLDNKLDALGDARDELESIRYDLETERESLDSLRTDRDEVEAELDAADGEEEVDVTKIEAELDRLRDRQQALDSTVKQLQSVIQFNEEMLEGTNEEIAQALRDDENGSVTDGLLADSAVVCWTCGSEVDEGDIEATLDRLRELRQEKIAERRSLKQEVSEQQSRRDEVRNATREYEQLERRLTSVEDEIERREDKVEQLQERRAELKERVTELEDEVESLEDETYSEVLDRHKDVNRREFELDRLRDEKREVEAELEEIERRLDDREDLEAEREEINEELEELRTRIDRIEREAVTEFNEHMDEVLSLLEYRNIDRIWIERTEKRVREGRRRVTKNSFDLHIIRSTDDGTAYEDTVDHLSESEREVTGLVFALAGYLVHEVYETCPFLLMDSLEAIDSNRIAALVDYFASFADNLVVALLPEDAQALDDDYRRVTDI
ncbi:archaea-specific SMC-related protein [Salinigranum halophilum]|jgi:DNA repair exonuclease SbcCD ATPase subunit|uniref:archaea-specific SMC-related protein n=1 Tax=Salinigranum halophilum TaxID=2565931 RepID=UPI0010A7E7BC|nr:archaea-specific SMC-related protein [Salinigranum halophilum]